MPGVTGGLSGDRIWSQESWAAERQDEMNGAPVNGKNREFSSGQPRLAAFRGARPGDRDIGRGRALVLGAYIKVLSLGSQVRQLHKAADTWENASVTPADHRHGLRLYHQRKVQDQGGGSWGKQWGLLVTVDRGVAKLEPDEKGTICTGGEVSNPSSCYDK